MTDRPTNTIMRSPNEDGSWPAPEDPAFEIDKARILQDFPQMLDMYETEEELNAAIKMLIQSEGLPNTRMGVVLGYEMEPGRMVAGTRMPGGQPYELPAQGRTWRSADVLDYVRDLWSMPDRSDFKKLAEGLLIEGFIDDIDDPDDLYDLDTVIDGVGAAIQGVSRRAAQFGLTEQDFTKDTVMDYVPTLEGMFADTDFTSLEDMLGNLIDQATEIPDSDYLRDLFDATSKQKAGFSIRKGNPGGYKQWLQGYRAAQKDKADRGEEMNAAAYATTGVERIDPEAVAMHSRKKYVALGNSLLSDYEGVSR